MTRDDIINMAQTAGWEMPSTFNENDGFCSRLERFAALVAAHEREACAKVCEERQEVFQKYYTKGLAAMCAEAIRARGEQ
jgi:hypothetical protein